MELGPGAVGFADAEARKVIEQLRKQVKEHELLLQARHEELSGRERKLEKRLLEDRRALESKEQALYEQMEQRAKMLEQREMAFAQKQMEREEELGKSRYEAEMARLAFAEEIKVKREQLDRLFFEAEQDRARYSTESQEAIQKNSGKFVSSALSTLGVKENRVHQISIIWAAIGAAALLLGVIFAILSMIYSAESFHQAPSSGLEYYFFHLFRGLIVVGIFAAISRYAFIFSNSYMHESLKVGERVHAIKFGEFYLDTYGSTAEWEQVREAFAHWNISGQSAFSRPDGGTLDVSFTGTAGKMAEKVIDIASKKNGSE